MNTSTLKGPTYLDSSIDLSSKSPGANYAANANVNNASFQNTTLNTSANNSFAMAPEIPSISLDRHRYEIIEIETRLQGKIQTLEFESKTQKDLLDAERAKRIETEDKLREKITELEVQLKSFESEAAVKLKSALKKQRQEIEEEFEDKMKLSEERFRDESEEYKNNIITLRKKNDELSREVDSWKRRVDQVGEEARLELAIGLETAKKETMSSEERERKLQADIKRLKDDNLNMATKLAMASQALQVAQSEKDTLESMAMHSKHESASNHSALVIATQRITELENEIGKLRAENALLSRAKEAQIYEKQKSETQSSYHEDRVEQAQRDLSKIKSQNQLEISRLSSRIIELDTIQTALRKQLDESTEKHEQEIRDFKRTCSRLEMECDRYKEKSHEAELRSNSDQVRISQLEKEVFTFKEKDVRDGLGLRRIGQQRPPRPP